MKCLICNELITENINWYNLLFSKQIFICTGCEINFLPLPVKGCSRCQSSKKIVRMGNSFLCKDCIKWDQYYGGRDVLRKQRAIYRYNSFLKSIFEQYKYKGDVQLGRVFVPKIRWHLKNFIHQNYVVIPLISSDEVVQSRRFNHVQVLLEMAKIYHEAKLIQRKPSKQSQKKKFERFYNSIEFKLETKNRIKDKKVIIFDDIYTTGKTIRKAAEICKKEGAEFIDSLTICRSILKKE